MKIVIFGLTVSSSWGNGHATLWRGLIKALTRRGCRIVFFERDVSYYAEARDMHAVEGGELVFYTDWNEARMRAESEIADADVALVTSFCPDGIAATELVLAGRKALRVFYDLDTPVTLAELREGKTTSYIGPGGLGGFDLVLSYTGGAALEELRTTLGARRVAPLYGHVDPDEHRPGDYQASFGGDLSYLGTYAADRQPGLDRFLLEPARRRPERRFVIGGAQYPADFPWTENIHFVRHLPISDHANFYASSRMTLNVTRPAMAQMGWCPSGRLFEAAACNGAIVSDTWPGLDSFFEPGAEILPVESTADLLAALELSDEELRRIGRNARERVLADHTSARRADELLAMFSDARHNEPAPQTVVENA